MAKKPEKKPDKKPPKKQVAAFRHDEASRKNIPTAEFQSVMAKEDQSPVQVAYQRRNRDLDPQLVWRGKDEKDWSDLVVPAPPQFDLFADFSGLPDSSARTEFYQRDARWTNRMILGDRYWVPAVNHLGTNGRWAFAEFVDVFEIEAEFDRVIEAAVGGQYVGRTFRSGAAGDSDGSPI